MQKTYLLLLLLACAGGLLAQPTIDGTIAGDTDYQLQASYTQGPRTGFGDYGIYELYTYQDGINLYVAITGVPENNFNKVLLMIDVVSNTNGVNAGTVASPLTGGPNGSATFDIPNLDQIFSMTRGSTNGSGVSETYYDAIAFSNGAPGNVTFIGGGSDDGSVLTTTATGYTSFQVAYDGDMAASVTDPNYTGQEAIEYVISLADLGVTTQATDIHLMAAYVGQTADFFSDNTLPEIPGLNNLNLENNPDFTAIAGDQFVTISGVALLPVDYLSFTARPVGKQIVLDWATATEENNEGFAVERSTDAVNFRRIGFVSGRGRSSGGTYAFVDDQTQAGVNYYYRLRQLDFDGSFEFSEVVNAQRTEATLALYPNPTGTEGALLNLGDTSAGQSVDLTLIDATGRQVRTQRLTTTGGPLPVATAGLRPGTYVVRIISAEGQRQLRLSVR